MKITLIGGEQKLQDWGGYKMVRYEPLEPEAEWYKEAKGAEFSKWLRDYKKHKEERYKEKKAELLARMRGQVWGGIQPQPRYRPAFYEALGGLPGSRPYLDWFESRFPSLIAEFEATLPTYKGFREARYAAEEAEKIGESWAEWLKGKQPELKERFWGMRPERRGEKPWAFQPAIRTRSF